MDSSQMENIIISKWDTVCRICLTDETILFPVVKLESTDEQHKMRICEMLNISSGLNYSPEDSFPQLICSLCITHMYNVLEFRTKCQSSENMLAKLLLKKEDLNKIIKCEKSEEEDSDDECNEMNDDSKNIEVTDFLKVDYILTSDKGQTEIKPKKLLNKKPKNDPLINEYICRICNTSYNTHKELVVHKKTHSKTGKRFTINLKKLKQLNDDLKTYDQHTCAECGKVFESKRQYRAHQIIHAKDKHLCTTCGKSLGTLSALNAHLRIHTGEKRYLCSFCGRKFLHWSDRRYHVRSMHTLEKPYACHLCDTRYSDKGHLTRHIRTHTGERPYSCMLCDMKFKGKSEVKMHMYKHTGEKKVFCEICNKGFTKNYNLKLHMVTHTGERNHVCSVCGKAFTQAHVLRTHMKLHPENKKPAEASEKETM